jgi:hypothetical protein
MGAMTTTPVDSAGVLEGDFVTLNAICVAVVIVARTAVFLRVEPGGLIWLRGERDDRFDNIDSLGFCLPEEPTRFLCNIHGYFIGEFNACNNNRSQYTYIQVKTLSHSPSLFLYFAPYLVPSFKILKYLEGWRGAFAWCLALQWLLEGEARGRGAEI